MQQLVCGNDDGGTALHRASECHSKEHKGLASHEGRVAKIEGFDVVIVIL